jgi:hypothetical protein
MYFTDEGKAFFKKESLIVKGIKSQRRKDFINDKPIAI